MNVNRNVASTIISISRFIMFIMTIMMIIMISSNSSSSSSSSRHMINSILSIISVIRARPTKAAAVNDSAAAGTRRLRAMAGEALEHPCVIYIYI